MTKSSQTMDNQPTDNINSLELTDLIHAIWTGKWIIIIFTSFTGVLTVFYALSLPNVYKAEALLAPVNNEASGLSGLSGQFGGLASLAGVSLGGADGTDKTTMGIKVLQSRQFFSQFMENNDVLVPLMAAENWDLQTNTLIINPEIYNKTSNTWVRSVKAPRSVIPSVQEAHEVFLESFSVSEDKESGFVTLSIEHFSPYIAKSWIDALVMSINETIRTHDVTKAERSIRYLQAQVKTTQLAELQAGLFELIQSQTETIMLANASPEYLFQTIDPAVVSEMKSKPKRALICVLGALLGGIIGMVIVIIRYFIDI